MNFLNFQNWTFIVFVKNNGFSTLARSGRRNIKVTATKLMHGHTARQGEQVLFKQLFDQRLVNNNGHFLKIKNGRKMALKLLWCPI